MSKDVNVSIAKIEKKLREIDEGKWAITVSDREKLERNIFILRRVRDHGNDNRCITREVRTSH